MTEDVFADPEALRHLTAYDRAGERIGAVDHVYVDDMSRRPEWVTVRTEPPHDAGHGETHEPPHDAGHGGSTEAPHDVCYGDIFVPLEGAAHTRQGVLEVAHTAEAVRDAPRMEAEQHLGLDQEQELYLHYGLTTPAAEASGAPGVGEDRPKTPVVGNEKALRGIKELSDEPPPPVPRLRRYVPGAEPPTAGPSGSHRADL